VPPVLNRDVIDEVMAISDEAAIEDGAGCARQARQGRARRSVVRRGAVAAGRSPAAESQGRRIAVVLPDSGSATCPRRSSPRLGVSRRRGWSCRRAARGRRDVAAARERDPAARGVSHGRDPARVAGVRRCSCTGVASLLHQAGLRFPCTASAGAHRRSATGIGDPSRRARRPRAVHRPRDGRRRGGDGGDRRRRDALPGRDARRHRLREPASATRRCRTTSRSAPARSSSVRSRSAHGAKIGANTVVIHDVPPNSTVVGNPGHPVRVEGRRPEGPDADWVAPARPDRRRVQSMSARITELERRIAELQGDGAEPIAEVDAAAAPPGSFARRGLGVATAARRPLGREGSWPPEAGPQAVLNRRPCGSGVAAAPCTPAPAALPQPVVEPCGADAEPGRDELACVHGAAADLALLRDPSEGRSASTCAREPRRRRPARRRSAGRAGRGCRRRS
jgi:serine O-acetyltransferase